MNTLLNVYANHPSFQKCKSCVYMLLISLLPFSPSLGEKPISQTADILEHTFTLSFLDGTPAYLSNSELDDLEIFLKNTDTEFIGAYISNPSKDTFLLKSMAGSFVMKFKNQEVVSFQVDKNSDGFSTDLPVSLKLPFNFMIEKTSDLFIQIFDEHLNQTESHQADEYGQVFLEGDTDFYSNMFILGKSNNNLPHHAFFKKTRPNQMGRFNNRKLNMSNHRLKAGKKIIHQIDRNIYHTLIKVPFTSDSIQSIYVLKSFLAGEKKSSIHKLEFPDNHDPGSPGLALDESGKLVLTSETQNYYLSDDGSLSESSDISIYPYYRFKGNYVKGIQWAIPGFMNIALPEGNHQFQIICSGKETVPNPENLQWQENVNQLQKRAKITTDAEELKSIGDAIKALGEEPLPRAFEESTTLKSSEIFQVIPSTKKGYMWEMQSPFNQYDPDRYYYPSGLDPEIDFNKIAIKKCSISIDGSNDLPYSHIDPYTGKGIMNMDFDSEEDRKKAVESAFENATVYIGPGPESDPWSTQTSLFETTNHLVYKEPINMWEGPHPKLMYEIKTVVGKYESRKEANNFCDNSVHVKGKFYCYEYSRLAICPNRFNYILENNHVKTDFDSFICGEENMEESMDKGDEIVIEASADGYITETRALSKRDMEAGEIVLSGTILDKEGTPIKGAQVRFKNLDGQSISDENGLYQLIAYAKAKKPYQESMDIKLQEVKLEISNEQLGKYKDKSFGIVSDGFTTLKLKVHAKGIRPQSVILTPPDLGAFVDQSALKIPLVLNSEGSGEMEYVPPKYLRDDQVTLPLALEISSNNQYGLTDTIWAAEIPLEFTFEDLEGNPGKFSMSILVCRPPVFLIHGFTGDETTWAGLAGYLRKRKYEAVIREYYQGPADESNIERQSQKLGFYVQKLRESYLENGIIQARIDIVAHSMGGLISRHYISNMSKYGKQAGIVIPYNVKLSREELATQRFNKPVVLNDVRKLIMVGTPNHGSSYIDEMFGALSALTSDYHQVAHAQLRYDHPFFATLNAGENEGRHLDPNVQYALIYGIRKRSMIYPPDIWTTFDRIKTSRRWLASDDGVVTISSAKLNGILNIPFPSNRENQYGYIHSPAVASFFPGDLSITEDGEIFNQIDDLLLEDIPRFPLKGSYTRFIQSFGETFFRYDSNKEWQKLSYTPGLASQKQLERSWCQVKTNEGNTSLGFFLNNQQWGSLYLSKHSIVHFEHASPEYVKVYLQQGSARFKSKKQNGDGFEVVMGDKGEKWYEFNPKAKVWDMDTDFIIEQSDSLSIYSIEGEIVASLQRTDTDTNSIWRLSGAEGILIKENAPVKKIKTPAKAWWTDLDSRMISHELGESNKMSLEETELFKYNQPDTTSPVPNSNINIPLYSKWEIKQSNGYSGTVYLAYITGDSIAGTAHFNDKPEGSIRGIISDRQISFTIFFGPGEKGMYTGFFNEHADEIKQGITRASNVTATWDALAVREILDTVNSLDPETKTVVEYESSLIFFDDFNRGLSHWTVQDLSAIVIDSALYWDTGNFHPTVLNTKLPMENFIIEFDGYCEKNGFNISMVDKRHRGYIIMLGGWGNTKSGSDIGKPEENRELVEGKLWESGKWHHYKIVRKGDYLTAYCDDSLIFERLISNRFKGEGVLKFDSWNTRLGLDNVQVYEFKPVEESK